MRVTFTTSDPGAVGCYRVEWPLEALAAQGKIEIADIDELQVKGENTVNGPVVTGVEGHPDTDVLILQRPTNAHIAAAIPFYQELGIAVVVELDDDLERLPVSHFAHQYFQPKRNPIENWAHLKKACRLADFVIVSSDSLLRYGNRDRVAVVRNYVPEAYLSIEAERSDGAPVVGWGGFVGNHPSDLSQTRGGVGDAVDAAGAWFRVVGDGERARQQLHLTDEPESTGKLPIDEYIKEVAKLDVGIAPIDDNQFGRAKSWLKGIEYASLGVFPVASDLPEYRLLQEILGDDLLPICQPRAREWKRAVLRQLDRSEEDRTELRCRASELTIEKNCDRWLEPLQQAIENRSAA